MNTHRTTCKTASMCLLTQNPGKGISVLEFLNIQEVFDNLNTAVEAYMRECENKIKALKESHENGP